MVFFGHYTFGWIFHISILVGVGLIPGAKSIVLLVCSDPRPKILRLGELCFIEYVIEYVDGLSMVREGYLQVPLW
jgi:hypothetical protein